MNDYDCNINDSHTAWSGCTSAHAEKHIKLNSLLFNGTYGTAEPNSCTV